MFNSLWMATVSSSGSITLSAGIYSSLVLIMKMRYCTCKPLQLFLAFGLVQRHAFQMQTQLHRSVTPTDAHPRAARVGVCFLPRTSGYILLIWSNQTPMMNTLRVSFFICLKQLLTKCRERERERGRILAAGFFSSVVFIDCFLCSSRSIFNLMSSKTEK